MQSLSERARELLAKCDTRLPSYQLVDVREVKPLLEAILPVLSSWEKMLKPSGHIMAVRDESQERRTLAIAQMAVIFRSGKLWSMEQCFEEAAIYLAEAEKRAK